MNHFVNHFKQGLSGQHSLLYIASIYYVGLRIFIAASIITIILIGNRAEHIAMIITITIPLSFILIVFSWFVLWKNAKNTPYKMAHITTKAIVIIEILGILWLSEFARF